MLLGGTTLAASAIVSGNRVQVGQAQQQPTPSGRKPNVLVIFGDDIGRSMATSRCDAPPAEKEGHA